MKFAPIPYALFVALSLIDIRTDAFGYIYGTTACGMVVGAKP